MTAAALRDFVRAHRSLFVLTGAGLSSGSGIPTYRDRDARWQRSAPIQHREFVTDEATRKRYWARSMAGWPLMGRARPNAAHYSLAELGRNGHVAALVTQNVDGLHQRAGSDDVIELHGNVRDVRCLGCGARVARATVQDELVINNRQLVERLATIAPDGDADITLASDALVLPRCRECGGTLKPDVVFFGDNVPRERVDRAFAALDESDAMLVVGSSLMVYSGFRFCERAAARGMPIASINQGRTRADDLLALKVDDDCAIVLSRLVNDLLSSTIEETEKT